jgi:putative molybdopterin biosynthesis protein
VERYLKGVPVRLVQLAKRQQGLLLRPGNPKGVKSIEDLTRSDVSLINRQAGSGTRILLDYYLKEMGISLDTIRGYEQEEFTHMAVAVSVLSGRADAGMAIYAAARALGLDFVPIAEERYDLVIPETVWEDAKLELLMNIIVSETFRNKVADLGGYDVSGSGTIMGRWDGEKWESSPVGP